jgi:hypothetical protein
MDNLRKRLAIVLLYCHVRLLSLNELFVGRINRIFDSLKRIKIFWRRIQPRHSRALIHVSAPLCFHRFRRTFHFKVLPRHSQRRQTSEFCCIASDGSAVVRYAAANAVRIAAELSVPHHELLQLELSVLTKELESVPLHDQHAHPVDHVANACSEIVEVEDGIEHTISAYVEEGFKSIDRYLIISWSESLMSESIWAREAPPRAS